MELQGALFGIAITATYHNQRAVLLYGRAKGKYMKRQPCTRSIHEPLFETTVIDRLARVSRRLDLLDAMLDEQIEWASNNTVSVNDMRLPKVGSIISERQ
jgi:hypothetical protein